MSTTLRLSALQWLQNSFFAATVVTLGTYLLETLQFSGREVGLIYATQAIAATLAPPAIGWLADRRFRADRMLCWLNVGAAVSVTACFFATDFWLFYPLILVVNLCFMPTFALLNAICFHQLEEPAKEYPFIRTWGTVGFIVVSLCLSFLGWEATALPLLLAAGLAIGTVMLSVGLNPIPPQPGFTWADLKGEEVRRIVREPGMVVLIVAMLLSCIPSAFYYSFVNPFLNEVGWSAPAAKMSLGQVVEIGALLSLPWIFRVLRFRQIVFWGLFFWGARYVAFAYGRPGEMEWLLYAGILVQGICFVWIVVAAQIYVDNRVPKALRSTAQGLVSFANQGVGMILGSWLAGEVVNAHVVERIDEDFNVHFNHSWSDVWWTPGLVGLVAAFLFWWLFPRTNRL